MLKPEPKYTLTEGHLALIETLDEFGLVVEDEREFPPYTVDCYVESLHLAFEYDGPHHSVARDKKRDKYLFARYGLPVIRVSDHSTPDALVYNMCESLLQSWKDSASLREQYAALGTVIDAESTE